MQGISRPIEVGMPRQAYIDSLIDLITHSQQTSHQGLTLDIEHHASQAIAAAKGGSIFPKSHFELQSMHHFYNVCVRKSLRRCKHKDHDQLKSNMLDICARIQRLIAGLPDSVAANSLQLIGRRMTILTFSFSSTILKSILLAHCSRRAVEVVVCQTEPMKEGRDFHSRLVEHGVRAVLIRDCEVVHEIGRCDLVALGAEAVLEDGSIITRVGSTAICLLAQAAGTEVAVFTESSKFIKKCFVQKQEIEAFRSKDGCRLLEIVEERHLGMFCTDFGVSTGKGVSEQMLQMMNRKTSR